MIQNYMCGLIKYPLISPGECCPLASVPTTAAALPRCIAMSNRCLRKAPSTAGVASNAPPRVRTDLERTRSACPKCLDRYWNEGVVPRG